MADSYNNKIKRILPRTKLCQTFAGEVGGGLRDADRLQALFREPAGLSAWEDRLYVADTNNNAIRVVDLASGDVSTLRLRGLGE